LMMCSLHNRYRVVKVIEVLSKCPDSFSHVVRAETRDGMSDCD
jgi:hypothetical protein